jgi:hypothetical protein
MLHTQQDRKLRRKTKRHQKRRRNQAPETKKPSRFNAANDFLKQAFLPFTDHVGFRKVSADEICTDFFRSLDHLSTLYKLEVTPTDHLPFPLNISSAFAQAKKQMEDKQSSLDLSIVSNENSKATIVTCESLNIGHTLYYMPLQPLLKLHSAKNKSCFQLALSVCGYLHHIVGMQLMNSNDYLTGNYEMIEEWVKNEPNEYDPEDYLEHLREINEMKMASKILDRAISNPIHLSLFAERVAGFTTHNHTEGKLLFAATQLLKLHHQYPDESFFRNFHRDMYSDENDEERMYPEQYFSFNWSNEGWLDDNLMEVVNSHLQELSEAEVPCSMQYFDSPQATETHFLDFENKMLNAICDFASALNNFLWKS